MAKSRSKELAVAVTRALEAAGFTPAALLQGPITLTDLAWQTPPIRVRATLAGLPFSSFVDYPVQVNEQAFYDFYCETLYALHTDPGKVCGAHGYRRLGASFGAAVPIGERLLRLPVPQGWPAEMDNSTGHLFAVECAHLAATSLACKSVVEDDSNFYVELPCGEMMGVIGGSPSVYGDLWDSDMSGAVSLLTTQGRGPLSNNCQYDVLAKVRSTLYENMDKFPEFEGLDYALQALRVMSHGRMCTELLSSIEGMTVAAFKNKRKLVIVDECLETMSSYRMSDREKLGIIFEKLVPEVMHMAAYQKTIFDPYRLVTVLQTATEAKIINRLKYLRSKFGGGDAEPA